ncbi:CPBP family intramembrane glutamic endopeptidase [Leucobacter luti]|uniref:CPBP family intramembrane glutamic endopeptidase n=1 Tax=Leucobacter luti TaxID=340320 RepID=UPI00215D6B29|nr:CPBP family intramembrane glutamic endopeptidase [Leucobacter luti]
MARAPDPAGLQLRPDRLARCRVDGDRLRGLGILLGWSRLRTGSVWPAVIAHGALNASAAIFLLGIAAGFEPNPVLVVPVGVAG